MTDDIDERAVLDKEIKGMLTASREYRQWWSIATHGSAWAIIAFSAIAAYLTKDSPQAAAILSLLVTIIAAAQIKIGFGRKWALFRIMQTELRLLQLDLDLGKPVDELRRRLEVIYKTHDQAIIGGTPVVSRIE